jgi:hypothetical protein
VKVDWVIIAEGLGTAANGAVTVIGFNQVLIVAPVLPTTTKRSVMIHLSGDEQDRKEGNVKLDLAVQVASPSGRTLAAQQAAVQAVSAPWPEVPLAFDVFAEFPIELPEYGTYTVSADFTAPDGQRLHGQANFYVVPPPQA